jgi:hypothetical protein
VSIYGEYNGKIFDTDLSAVAANYIHWHLPGLGSRAAVTACSVFATPGVMVLRLNQSLKYRELLTTPDCSGPAPTFVPL